MIQSRHKDARTLEGIHMLELPENETSLWREAYPEPVYPALTEDMEADVVIVGAGITGLTTGYLLKQSGLRVVVLDKDTVGGGTSGRTTGKVTSQHSLNYHDLANRLGKKAARIYGEANQAAIEQVSAIIAKEKIPCDWHRDTSCVFTTDPEKVAMFEQEARTAAGLGLPAAFETSLPLPFEVQGAVTFANQAKIHSQKYLLGLAAAVDGNRSYVFEHSGVTSIRDGRPGRVSTSKATVAAKSIVVATNVPTFPLMARTGYCLLEYPTVSYAVAGRLEKELHGMYISPDAHHHSILPAEIDGKRMLLIVGAGGHLPGLGGDKEARYRQLAAYAEKHFGVQAITHRWSDRDYIAYDHIPLVGKLYPWSQNLYVATAFKKWGLSNGTVAGMILRDLITGAGNAWASTFTATRLRPVASLPREFIRHLS